MTHLDLASLSLSLMSIAFPAVIAPIVWRWVYAGAAPSEPPCDPNLWSYGSHASEA